MNMSNLFSPLEWLKGERRSTTGMVPLNYIMVSKLINI